MNITSIKKVPYERPVVEIVHIESHGAIMDSTVIHDDYYGDDWEYDGDD